MDRERGATVVFVGIVPHGPSGVRDYGRLLAEELSRRGVGVGTTWIDTDGRSLAASVAGAVRLCRAGLRLHRGDTAVWHYSSMPHGFRGLPMPGVLFGLVARVRGARVVTVLHEPGYPWGPRGWRGRVQSVTQAAALRLVLAGSTTTVVTTPQRAQKLHHQTVVVPVFCTVPVGATAVPAPAEAPGEPGRTATVAVVGWSGDGARPDLVVDALAAMDEPSVHALLVGAPGPSSPAAARWRRCASARGVGHRISFTGVVPAGEYGHAFARADLVLFANEEGPSGRRTTIAAALAHGRPLVALDGLATWSELVEADAVAVVPASALELAATMAALLADGAARARLAARGRVFYGERMAAGRCADAFIGLLGLPGPVRPAR